MTSIKSPHPYATAPMHPAYQSYQPYQPYSAHQPAGVPVTYGDMYQLLGQAEGEIKKIRGWHGSRLAAAGGAVGATAAMTAGGAAVLMTGGAAAPVIAGAALVGVVAVSGGTAGSLLKTRAAKRACKQNSVLMDKIGVLKHLRAKLKEQKHSGGLSPAQRRLYRDLKEVTQKVDRSSRHEARNTFGTASLGAVGAVVGTAAVAGIVLLGAAAGAGGGGGDIICCFGGGDAGGCGCMGGASVRAPKGDPSAVSMNLTGDQLHALQQDAHPVAP